MTEKQKIKISNTMKARGIKPLYPKDWTGLKHPRPNPRIGEKRPKYIGKKISKAKKGHRVLKETRVKISQTLTGRFVGEKSPCYIPDRTKLKTDRQKMFDYRYRDWSRQIKIRDKWKCKINNRDCKGRLESHHILNWKDYPKLRYDINNGITLCHFHHPRARKKEKRLRTYFKKLIS